jgi:N-acetyl-anhydromuramyl-L-alanine amidase AmpD
VPNWNKRTERRIGIMVHYDASTSDAGAVAWLTRDPRCKVSYNDIVLDDGRTVAVAPRQARAYHAGVCRSSDPQRLPYKDANSAFYGVAIAAGAGDVVTDAQFHTVCRLCATLFRAEGWSLRETWRIVGHDSEAWPRGRKSDPTGPDPRNPVLSVAAVRANLLSEDSPQRPPR